MRGLSVFIAALMACGQPNNQQQNIRQEVYATTGSPRMKPQESLTPLYEQAKHDSRLSGSKSGSQSISYLFSLERQVDKDTRYKLELVSATSTPQDAYAAHVMVSEKQGNDGYRLVEWFTDAGLNGLTDPAAGDSYRRATDDIGYGDRSFRVERLGLPSTSITSVNDNLRQKIEDILRE